MVSNTYKSGKLFFWSFAQHWSARIISLLSFFILARILNPKDFGIIAIASIFVGISELVSDQGFGDAVVRHPQIDASVLNSAFFANMAISVAIALVIFFLSPVAAELFKMTLLEPVLKVLCLSFVLNGFASVQTALLKRQGRYKSLATRTVIASITGSVVGVSLALGGYGVWALVAQQITYTLSAVIFLWLSGSYRPSRCFSWREVSDITKFSINIVVMKVSDYFHTKSIDALVGVFLGAVAAGVYSIGTRLGLIIVQLFGSSISDVALTQFSRMLNNRREAQQFFIACLERFSFLSGSAFLFAAINSHEIIDIVFGRKWVASAPILSAFCIAGLLQVAVYIASPVIAAKGRAGLLAWLSFAKLGTVIACFFIAYWMNCDLGVIGGIVCIVPVAIFMPISLYFAGEILQMKWASIVLILFRVYFAFLASAALMFIFRSMFEGNMQKVTASLFAFSFSIAVISSIYKYFCGLSWRDLRLRYVGR